MTRTVKRFKILSIIPMALVLVLAACMPVKNEEINAEYFKGKDDMKSRTAELRPGMTKEETFEIVGIPEERFEQMSTDRVQASIYGNSVVQGSPEDLERFRWRLAAMEGYALRYRDVHSGSTLGLGKMRVRHTGHDLRMVLIFDRGRLVRATVEGQSEIEQAEDQYMWDGLVRRGIFSAF